MPGPPPFLDSGALGQQHPVRGVEAEGGSRPSPIWVPGETEQAQVSSQSKVGAVALVEPNSHPWISVKSCQTEAAQQASSVVPGTPGGQGGTTKEGCFDLR